MRKQNVKRIVCFKASGSNQTNNLQPRQGNAKAWI